jgi:ABC-type sugar transport system permease subunit
LPALLLIAVFFVVPIGITSIISMTGLDYRFRWDFVGLANCVALFQDALIRPGITMLSLFAFLSGWGEYVFLLTFILEKRSWTLSRYVASILYPIRLPFGVDTP